MHFHTLEQDKAHQRVVEDLVNDLFCNCLSFIPRRRRQRPSHLVVASVAPPSPRHPLQPPPSPRHHLRTLNGRECGHPRQAYRTPSTTSPKHDSLRKHHETDMSSAEFQRTRSEPLQNDSSTSTRRPPVDLHRTPPPCNVAPGLGRKGVHLKNVAKSIMHATNLVKPRVHRDVPSPAPTPGTGRKGGHMKNVAKSIMHATNLVKPRVHTDVDVAARPDAATPQIADVLKVTDVPCVTMMMKWEHQQRLAISGARTRACAREIEEITPAPPTSTKVVAKWSTVKTSLAPSIGSILTQSFGCEQFGWNRLLGVGEQTPV